MISNYLQFLQEKLKNDTVQLAEQLENYQKKLQEREIELVTVKQVVDAKTNEVKLHEASLEDKTSVIHSLSKEIQAMKTKMENLRQEKTKIEIENKKRIQEVNDLKTKIEKLQNKMKMDETNVNEIKQKVKLVNVYFNREISDEDVTWNFFLQEDEWKSMYEKIKVEVESLRETCEIQDRINVGFETRQEKLEQELQQHENEKLELQVWR